MRLDEVIRGIAITDRRGNFDAVVDSITQDSRRVSPGTLFVAVRGRSHDGHAFIRSAIDSGAVAVVAESWPDDVGGDRKTNVILVRDSRRALALVAANFFGQPTRSLHVAGVTGTNGKTTVTYLLESIMRAAGKKVGVVGTVDCRYGNVSEKLEHTTPDALSLQRKFAEMLRAGVSHVVMEVSSHAIDQHRVAGVHFKVAGFTNLSRDHLDYHESLDAYFEAKARLFSQVLRKSRARGRMAVVDVDDARGPELIERWGGKSLRVSMNPSGDADIATLEATYGLDGTRARIRTSKGEWEISTALIGPHNMSNILVAIGIALAMGFSRARIVRGISALERVPGRLERVPGDPSKTVFVDYAHTPDALAKSLAALRPLAKGRLIVVFGCGGDRDTGKREPMGRVVATSADIAIVTNDNPRTEDPRAIAEAIRKGLDGEGFGAMEAAPRPRSYLVQLDRRLAIRNAIDWMGPDDVLVIAGKGHETHQIVGRAKAHFDDREEARRVLAGMPPLPPLMFEEMTSELPVESIEASHDVGACVASPPDLPATDAPVSMPEGDGATANISDEDVVDALAVATEIPPTVPDATSGASGGSSEGTR